MKSIGIVIRKRPSSYKEMKDAERTGGGGGRGRRINAGEQTEIDLSN